VTNSDLLLGTRSVLTPYNWAVVLIGNQLQVLQQTSLVQEPSNDALTPTTVISDSPLLWPAVIDLYGTLRPGISQIRLEQRDGTEVIGTVSLNPNDSRFLIYDIDADTAPQNTLEPVDAVINPMFSGPQDGLDSAMDGQRYLLTESTGSSTGNNNPSAWVGANGRPLVANANDIIQYANNYWQVVFRALGQPAGQYVTNITTNVQYEWNGDAWVKSYQGVYPGGQWGLVL
jgi:hypothetical protein